jgi:hypothetical protein
MLNKRHRRSAGLGSGRVAVALSASALVVALLGVIPVGSAGNSAVELAKGTINGSPAANQKLIVVREGREAKPERAARRASPELRESEVRRAYKDRKETVARRANEVNGVNGAPLERE